MVRICIQKLQIPLLNLEFAFECPVEWFEFGFECSKHLSNCYKLHPNASNPFRMAWICIGMLWILLKWFKFGFECFESLSNGLSLHLKMLRIPFEWFECFEFDLNASNTFRMVRICIRMVWIPFKWFECGLECFESLCNASNLHSNVSNPFRIVRICIRMLRIPFEWFEFASNLQSNGSNLHSNGSNLHSNGSNLHSKGSNPFLMVRICIRKLQSLL